MSSSCRRIPSKNELALAAQASEVVAAAQFLDVLEVAGVLRVSAPTVRRMLARGELKAHRFGRCIRIENPILKAE
jgi:excisionase family DNA binding protein